MAIALSLSESFGQKIEREFVQGSAIAPELLQAAIRVASDIEVGPGGEPETPIHDALNWSFSRFGYQARESLEAALLLNESGSCWQAKLSRPRFDKKKGSDQKYESVLGADGAYLPPVPIRIRQAIATRYGIDVPLLGSFWEWLELHPEVPIEFTEGGKKSLCLLSQGYAAIALYGVNGGYRVRDKDKYPVPPYLLADVARFAVSGRSMVLSFDQDTKRETRLKVSRALSKFGGLLVTAGCEVAIALWKPEQGKGVDDLCVQSGADAVHQAIANALTLDHWRIWQRLEGRLTWGTSLHVRMKDLSTLKPENLPSEGILAVASPKATGKTKLISSLVQGQEKVLSATHRVALGRNLAARLGLDWRGDLDKANGQFISGAAYTLRVGSCVDGLLAIDPEKFRGCDLVIDEVVQVLRHLLTSSTTNQDGKRPALLARFKALIQVAGRVIVADADLDNATLHCLRELRGDDQPIYLIRNSYQPNGFPTRFIQSKDRTAIIADLMKQAKELPAGQVLMVATDSKQAAKSMARLIQHQFPEKRLLVIHSDTSGGEAEREFVQTPDAVLARGEYDIILCSPSVATGVSIEIQGVIAAVYGIFTGGSSTDADMAQALGRVREPVERVVWCAERGSNFSKVSRETNPLKLKTHLQQRTSAVVSLVRCSLREDIQDTIAVYDWQADPYVNLFCQMEAERNRSMFALRDSLLVRLRHEGNQVTVEDRNSDQAGRILLRQVREELKQLDATAKFNAAELTHAEVLLLQQKENPSPDERLAIARYYLKDFYCLDTLTLDDVLWDNDGRRRGEILGLEALLYLGVAVDRTVKGLEKQSSWNQGVTPWDISSAELRRRLQAEIGLPELLEKMRAGWEWGAADIQPNAEKARSLAPQFKAVCNITIKPEMSDTQIIHQLLSQMGLKFTRRQTRTVERGKVTRLYQLDLAHWQRLEGILHQRQQRREAVTPPPVEVINQGGVTIEDPAPNLAEWLTPEGLSDVASMWRSATTEEMRADVRSWVPSEVLKRAVA